jgi:hypothetical protein
MSSFRRRGVGERANGREGTVYISIGLVGLILLIVLLVILL